MESPDSPVIANKAVAVSPIGDGSNEWRLSDRRSPWRPIARWPRAIIAFPTAAVGELGVMKLSSEISLGGGSNTEAGVVVAFAMWPLALGLLALMHLGLGLGLGAIFGTAPATLGVIAGVPSGVVLGSLIGSFEGDIIGLAILSLLPLSAVLLGYALGAFIGLPWVVGGIGAVVAVGASARDVTGWVAFSVVVAILFIAGSSPRWDESPTAGTYKLAAIMVGAVAALLSRSAWLGLAVTLGIVTVGVVWPGLRDRIAPSRRP